MAARTCQVYAGLGLDVSLYKISREWKWSSTRVGRSSCGCNLFGCNCGTDGKGYCTHWCNDQCWATTECCDKNCVPKIITFGGNKRPAEDDFVTFDRDFSQDYEAMRTKYNNNTQLSTLLDKKELLVFSVFDVDGDGYINKTETLKVNEIQTGKGGIEMSELEMFINFNSIDENGDGVIEPSEMDPSLAL